MTLTGYLFRYLLGTFLAQQKLTKRYLFVSPGDANVWEIRSVQVKCSCTGWVILLEIEVGCSVSSTTPAASLRVSSSSMTVSMGAKKRTTAASGRSAQYKEISLMAGCSEFKRLNLKTAHPWAKSMPSSNTSVIGSKAAPAGLYVALQDSNSNS